MEGPLSFYRLHCGHALLAIPCRTESADKSDALQTLRAPAESADDASAFGVRASSAPLSLGRLRFDGGTRSWKSSIRFSYALRPRTGLGVPAARCPAFRRPGPAKARTTNRRKRIEN